jgi:hypothetical protein
MEVSAMAADGTEPERRELLIQLHPRVGYVHPGLTPLLARELNQRAVTSALDAAGVDYFVVRGMDDRTPVVGVVEEDRPRVVKALGRLGEQQTGYVSTILPTPPVRDLLSPANSRATWRAAERARVIRLTWFRTEPTGNLVFGPTYGCDVEFWTRDQKRARLIAPRPNRMMKVVDADRAPVTAPGERFTRLAPAHRSALAPVRTREEFTHTLPEEIDFPIDVVYTWVDGSDPAWQRRRAEATGEAYHQEAASAARYINRDELRYSLRSLHLNAPWVRNVYVVTDDQTPAWLNLAHPRVRLVSHKEIFADPGVLPTYNSFAIESQLHHIEGLAEHFLYLNDDMFLGRPVAPQNFFLANGQSKFFLSQTRVALGPVSAADTPIDVTVKNNRTIIAETFGRTITQCSQHVPYALRRSVLAELEERYPGPFRATMASRFRGLDNISVTYSLHHYYAFHTGRALPGQVRYGYIQLAVPDLADRLARTLARRDWDTFCLNDAYSTPEQIDAQNAVLLPFLDAYFPLPSPYESPA